MKISKTSTAPTIKLGRAVALIGSAITFVQALLLMYEREGICFNDGCEVVDSLTTIDPILINLGGFVFFQTVFWGLWLARNKPQRLGVVRVILLAGISVEAVLVAFQYLVAQTFCSYCLLILGLIIILNLLAGVRHTFAAMIIFAAVLTGFASLQFSGAGNRLTGSLDEGIFASLDGDVGEKRYLFFSSTCKYCEEVIVSLQDGYDCAMQFSPIDEITEFALPQAKRQSSYNPSINKSFLQQHNLDQIPVLYVERETGFQAIAGAGAILDYLEIECGKEAQLAPTLQMNEVSQEPVLDFLQPQEESCSVDTDCEEIEGVPQFQ